jgi:hypothetical protein
MRAGLAMPLAALAVVAAAGCNEYHYYDLQTSFNTNTAAGGFGTASEVTTILQCLLTVSGADNASLRIGPNNRGLPITDPAKKATGTLGIIEFATFADSGQLNFTMECWDGMPSAECKTGEGNKTINATATVTTMDTFTINKVADGCNPAMP